ncbi:MAG TPA: PQQ-binding-like beta-propeller repeat protein [Candidatus Hydrogenedentes bacterium]|nr:PQQ-binding-like beta-propeller repeat protein [Candidatus Hydrogenedentota bacterium]
MKEKIRPLFMIMWLLAAGCYTSSAAHADEWPTFRHDNSRSAVSQAQLVLPLQAQWTFTPPHPPQPAWPEDQKEMPRVRFDEAYHVSASGNAIFFGTSSDNKLCCLDAQTGEPRWTFLAGGPIRIAPTVQDSRVYFGSDDGCAYCLRAEDGQEVWRVRAAFRDEKLIGNGRMISTWPVRTGILLEDGVAYFGAGVFPHESLFLLAVKAEDGTRIWCNDSFGEEGYKVEYGGISPQGPLLSSAGKIFMPSGRAMPAVFNQQDGTFISFLSPRGHFGGTWALITDDRLVAGVDGKRTYTTDKGDFEENAAYAWFPGLDLVVNGPNAYMVTWDKLIGLDRTVFGTAEKRRGEIDRALRKLDQQRVLLDKQLKKAEETERANLSGQKEETDKQIQAFNKEIQQLETSVCRWQRDCQQHNVLAMAGNTLFLGGDNVIAAADSQTGEERWTAPLKGRVCGIAIANGQVFASLDTGQIACFSSNTCTPRETSLSYPSSIAKDEAAAQTAQEILDISGVKQGFCLAYGSKSASLLQSLAEGSALAIIAVDDDAQRVSGLRTSLDAAGLYGTRITVDTSGMSKLPYADYFANLIIAEDTSQASLEELHRLLKPCGGVLLLPASETMQTEWGASPDFTVEEKGRWFKVTRNALPGAGQWSHQYADPGNTACSEEQRVKGPLGLLWYGLPGPAKMVERHARSVAPVAMDGRMFIQGEHRLMAYDSYNGLKLWEREVPGAVRVRVDSDMGNLALTHDGLYAAVKDGCLRLDPGTGEIMRTYALPGDAREPRRWGYIAYSDGMLFGSVAAPLSEDYGDAWELLVEDDGTWADIEEYAKLRGLNTDQKQQISSVVKRYPEPDTRAFWNAQQTGFLWHSMTSWPVWGSVEQPVGAVTERIMASKTVFAMNPENGEVRWRYDGTAVAHPAIALGGGMMFLADCSATEEQKQKAIQERKDLIQRGVWEKEDIEYGPQDADVRLVVALDAATGVKRWERVVDLTGCGGDRMGVTYKNGVICFFGCFSNHDREMFKQGKLAWRRVTVLSAKDGSDLWSKPLNYLRRPVVVNDTILVEPRACNLYDGAIKTRLHPLTGEESTWEYVRPGHCCSATSACPSMFFLRGYFLWYYDLERDQGMLPFGGIRPGCWINTIPANGLVLFPEADAACTCSYPIRATVALAPKKDLATYALCVQNGPMTPVKHMAVNFGAPGDWRDENGVMWFSYPHPPSSRWYDYGVNFNLSEEFYPGHTYFSHNFQDPSFGGMENAWVFASGCSGLKKCSVPLIGKDQKPGRYTVRLYFGKKRGAQPGDSVFSVALQGRTVSKKLDISRKAGSKAGIIKEYGGVQVENVLEIEMNRLDETSGPSSLPVLCGVELLREE